MQELLHRLGQYADTGEPCALATVIEIRGSASARAGSKALIDRHGNVISGWVGRGGAASRSGPGSPFGVALGGRRNSGWTTARKTVGGTAADEERLGSVVPGCILLAIGALMMLLLAVGWLL